MRLEIHERNEQAKAIPEAIVNPGSIVRLLRFHSLRREKKAAQSDKECAKIASVRRMATIPDEPVEQPTAEPVQSVR